MVALILQDLLFGTVIRAMLTCFGLYGGTSLLLLHKPSILHKVKPRRVMNSAKHISHRGGCGELPENTFPAFDNAIAKGTQILEIDVHLTKDKKVVVFHDPSLFRVTGQAANIRELNYDELPTKFKSHIGVPFSTQTVTTEGVNIKIPLLEDVLQKYPTLPLNIDIKAESDELIDETHQLLKKYKRTDSVIWGSFRESTTKKLHAKDSTVPLFFSMAGTAKLLLAYYTGVLPFMPIKESYLEIPVFSKEKIKSLASLSAYGSKLNIAGVLAMNLLVSPGLFSHLNKRGISVFSWVQNDEGMYDYCFKNGVNGVMTDFPTKLGDYLQKNKISE